MASKGRRNIMRFQSLKTNWLIASALTIFFFLVIGCATTGNNEQTKTVIVAPTSELLKGVKKVAVLDFEGYEQEYAGQAVAADIIVKLTNLGRYDVLEREQLKKILTEHALAMSGIVAPDTAIKLGNILGADALIMGKVVSWTVEEKEVMQEDWGKFLGVLVDKNYDTRSPHLFRHAYVKVIIKVGNVEKGTIQTAGTFEKRIKQVERMTDSYGKMRTKQELLQQCVDDIANQFLVGVTPAPTAKRGTPVKEIPKIQFYSGGSKYFKEAYKYAIRQLWPEAKELWEKALTESQEKGSKKDVAGTYYNMGLYYEAAPNYAKAEQEYKTAYELDNKDNYLDRLSSVRKEWEAKGKLNAMPSEDMPPPMMPPTDTVSKKAEKDPYYYGASKNFKEGSKFAVRQLWPEAKEAWEKALSESQEKENKKDIAGSHHNLGLFYMAVSNFGAAEQEFKVAYEFDSKDQYLDRLAEARLQHEAQEKIERATRKAALPILGPATDSTKTKESIKKKKTRKKKPG